MTAAQIIAIRSPSTVIDSRINSMVILAAEQLGSVFGTKIELAKSYLVLHWLALELRGTAAAPGAIKSEKEGDLTRSYGTGGKEDPGDLGSTSWGLQLQRLKNGLIMSVRNRTI